MTKNDNNEELETLPNNETDELIPNENLDKMMQELKKEAQEQSTVEEIKETQAEDAKEKVLETKEPKSKENTTKKKEANTSVTKAKTVKAKKTKATEVIEQTIEQPTLVEDSKADPVVKALYDKVEKFNLFFVSDMDEEAEYLHKMSLDGYHFQKKNGIRYEFKHEEPKNYYYHLGYYEKDKRDGERYLENYKEAGWVSIYNEKAEFDGVWHYFRSEAADGEEPTIFSDRGSREALYKRLLTNSRSLLAMVLICSVAMIFIFYFLLTHPSNISPVLLFICTLMSVALLITLIVYTHIYRKISKKLFEQKYQ